MIKKLIAVVLICGSFSGLAYAETVSHSCRSATTEQMMYGCLQQQLKENEALLEQAYQTLEARYKDDPIERLDNRSQFEMLKKAHQAWVDYRDASCDFETYESITGSGFGSIYTACLLEKTQERVKYLNWFVENP